MKKWWLLAVVMAFSAGLGVAVGQRLSQEAMVILLGIVAGIAASIPTSLLVVWVTRPARPAPPVPDTAGRPQIIVVPAPAPNSPARHASTEPCFPNEPARAFTVIGGEEILEAEVQGR